MGLTALYDATHGVFLFLRDFYSAIPWAVRQLILLAFGGTVFIALFKSIWR